MREWTVEAGAVCLPGIGSSWLSSSAHVQWHQGEWKFLLAHPNLHTPHKSFQAGCFRDYRQNEEKETEEI